MNVKSLMKYIIQAFPFQITDWRTSPTLPGVADASAAGIGRGALKVIIVNPPGATDTTWCGMPLGTKKTSPLPR